MDIVELAKSSGFLASALRFYEAKGLIQSTDRIGLRRIFTATLLELLAMISLGAQLRFIAGRDRQDVYS